MEHKWRWEAGKYKAAGFKIHVRDYTRDIKILRWQSVNKHHSCSYTLYGEGSARRQKYIVIGEVLNTS